MKQLIMAVLAFLITCVISAFIAWCSGFNFDHRSESVGFYVSMTVFAGTFAAIIGAAIVDENTHS